METGHSAQRRKTAVTLALALPWLLAQCGAVANLRAKQSAKKQQKALAELVKANAAVEKERLGEQAVGEISYVDEESGFVLVKQLVGKTIAPSTPLVAKGPGGESRLLASPAAKGSFVAADIVKGNPRKGDAVSINPQAPPKPAPAEAASAKPAASTETPATGTAAAEAAEHKPPKIEPLLPPLEPLTSPADEPELPSLPPSLPLPQ